MLNLKLVRTLVLLLLAAACLSAGAGVITYQGVSFTATTSDHLLMLEIDAAHPTGDWTGATTIGALELQGIGTFSGVHLVQAPGAAAGWTLSSGGLTAKGCTGGSQPGKFACFSGQHVNLQDDMVFRFTFDGVGTDLASPEIKVNFFADDSTKKAGTLLSQIVPADEVSPPPPAPVPEPLTAALLAGGLVLMAAFHYPRRLGEHD